MSQEKEAGSGKTINVGDQVSFEGHLYEVATAMVTFDGVARKVVLECLNPVFAKRGRDQVAEAIMELQGKSMAGPL